MDRKFSFQQILVMATAATALVAIALVSLYQMFADPDPIVLNTAGHPTIGSPNATVEVVVFEDFQCVTCQFFSDEIYPKIKTHYIDTGKVRYTFIPVAFMDDSKSLANAAIAVYELAPDRFFPFIHELFHAPKVGRVVLLELAGKVGGINLAEFKKSIHSNRYLSQVEENLKLGQAIMGKQFGTPAVFVNGVKTSPMSFGEIQTRIEKALYLSRGNS